MGSSSEPCRATWPYYRVRTAERVAAILLALTDLPEPVSVRELSLRLGIDRTAVQRLVMTLRDVGLLEQDCANRRYHLSPRVLELAAAYLRDNPVACEASRVLAHLAQATGMTCAFGIREELDVLYVAVAEGTAVVRAVARAGNRTPLHATASGKCLLAFRPAAEAEEIVRRLTLNQLTPFTITNAVDLLTELDRTRTRGYAASCEERTRGLCGIAVPVPDASGTSVSAISVAVPVAEYTAARLKSIVELALSAAKTLTARFGVVDPSAWQTAVQHRSSSAAARGGSRISVAEAVPVSRRADVGD